MEWQPPSENAQKGLDLGLPDSQNEAMAFIQDGIHVQVNAAYMELFGSSQPDDLVDTPLLDLIDRQHHGAVRAALKQIKAGCPDMAVDIICRCENGKQFAAVLYLIRDSLEGEPGIGAIIREKRWGSMEMGQQIQGLHDLDPDTQLPNQDYCIAQLKRWQHESAHGDSVSALLLFTLDKLPQTGNFLPRDALIKSSATLLRQGIAPDDVVTRFSEDSFALLCRRRAIRDVEQFADALRRRLETGLPNDRGSLLTPTYSVGIALIQGNQNTSQLLHQLHHACERAYDIGGNQIIFATLPREIEISDQVKNLIQEVDETLAANRCRLAYQPIINLQGESREHYGVLMRVLDANGEEWLPELFLQQAEQVGKLPDIDRWVVRQAIAILSEQRRQGAKVSFSLTVSCPSLQDNRLLPWIYDCLKEFQAGGSWLTFQIREKHAREHLRETLNFIDGLKKVNCQVALDRFGLLPKPETLLDQLPLDFVRLAPSFVEKLASDQHKQDVLYGMHQLILSHGMQTIATGVEDSNSLSVLWTLGVGYIQGNFLQEPSLSIAYPGPQRV